jgi:hypothetical protein
MTLYMALCRYAMSRDRLDGRWLTSTSAEKWGNRPNSRPRLMGRSETGRWQVVRSVIIVPSYCAHSLQGQPLGAADKRFN